jgi:hypothetical protein
MVSISSRDPPLRDSVLWQAHACQLTGGAKVTCSLGQAALESALLTMQLGTGETNHTVLSPRSAPGAEECMRLEATLLILDALAQFAGWVADSENDSGADPRGSRGFAVVGFKFSTLMDIPDAVVAEVCPSPREQGIPSRACNSALVTIMLW